jgi:leucyl/phenylalanyl-tRNA---protein transferase
MPVYRLSEKMAFPHPNLANGDGLLAVGGDLSVRRLMLAYCNGIFPWFSKGDPVLWWSPDPRFILFPGDIKVSTSMRKFLRKNLYKVTFDTSFKEVITSCANQRAEGTWITDDMVEAYCTLHTLGYAHSVEAWYGDSLVGGLYGVSIGSCFFGESMFTAMDNASKVALITLGEKLLEKGFSLIDCQVYSKHLESLGSVKVARVEFLKLVEAGLQKETLKGDWGFLLKSVIA